MKNGFAGQQHASQVGATEPTLGSAAGLAHEGVQIPARGPGPREQPGERHAATEAHGDGDPGHSAPRGWWVAGPLRSRGRERGGGWLEEWTRPRRPPGE